MEELKCPSCGGEVEKIEKGYQCKACGKKYVKRAKCPECGEKLEMLRACGATNLWCNKCNELKSKKEAIYYLEEV